MEQSSISEIERKKRSLKRYKKNLACIDRLEVKLGLVTDRLMSAKSPKLSGMPRGGTPTTTEDLVAEKIELEERIKRLKEKSRVLRKETLAEIDRLEDPKQAEILEGFFRLTLTAICSRLLSCLYRIPQNRSERSQSRFFALGDKIPSKTQKRVCEALSASQLDYDIYNGCFMVL